LASSRVEKWKRAFVVWQGLQVPKVKCLQLLQQALVALASFDSHIIYQRRITIFNPELYLRTKCCKNVTSYFVCT
jgi:hypothetical protein